MRSKSRFADVIGEHVRNVLLNDDVPDLACDATPAIDAAMGRLPPLFTFETADTPFRTRTLFDAASPDRCGTMDFRGAPPDKFASPARGHAPGLREAMPRTARQQSYVEAGGPSSLDPSAMFATFAGKPLRSREVIHAHGMQVLESFHANLSVI